MKKKKLLFTFVAVALVVVLLVWLARERKPKPGEVVDEAKAAGKTVADFPQADEDYFEDMDGGIALTPEETKGRNTWLVWTAGNDAFWDYMANNSFGALDLLKTISSHPSLAWKGRDERFYYLGLMNEPGFEKATGPDPDRYGLRLDKRIGPPDPFENAEKYPGVNGGSFYGQATGVLGLRLFPNPAFDEKAKKKWNPERYYTDPAYHQDKNLVRPYRVGMACSFCHVGPNPVNPPANPENPKWENISSNVGAQYFWIGRIFFFDPDPSNFAWQLFQTPPAGSLDTSLIATDNINNPRTMNAVYSIGPRLEATQRWGKEKLAGGALEIDQLPQIGDIVSFRPPDTVWTTHILKDGSDSVGILGALNRVYLNIGEFHQEWILHFNPLVGGKPQTPIEIAVAKQNSTYWNATADRALNLALFFLKSARPHYLKDAPGGRKYLTKNKQKLTRGKIVFAEQCMKCHSSKLPPDGIPEDSGEYLRWMRREVLKDDFLENNFLSNDVRYPVSEIGSNACSTLATNATRDQVWDNFSSQTYKELPSVGKITVHDPIDGTPREFEMPGGGLGYIRSPSLISMWSTAPFLLNNSVGKFVNSPSVEARMESFNDSIESLLGLKKRERKIYKTTAVSYVKVAPGYLPDFLRSKLVGNILTKLLPWILKEGMLEIGPIPKGTPIGLLSNLDVVGANKVELIKLLFKIKKDLKRIERENLNDEQSAELLKELVPDLLKLSKCPDFVVNRGHEYGSNLSKADKQALIEFLKTF